MNNKVIFAVFAVVVLVGAGAGAMLLINNDSDTKEKVNYGGELKIYGNANEDSVVDDQDLDYIQDVIDGKVEKTAFSDANNDGKVDESDIQQVKDMIARKDGTTVYYVDGSDAVAKVTWPLKSFVVLSNSPQLMANAVGLSYPEILAYTKVDSVVFKKFEGAQVISDGIDNFESITSNGIPDAVIVGSSTTPSEASQALYTKAGVDIIRIAGMDSAESSSSALTLGYLVNHIEQSQKYSQWCHDMLADIESKVATIAQEKRHTALIWFGAQAVAGTTGSGLLYTQALQAAGAISVADFENYQKLTADNNTWLLNYHNEYMIRVYTMGYSVDDSARQAVYDKYAAMINQTDAYKAGNYCVIDFTLPQILRIAYIAEFMYPEVFGTGYGDSWHQQLLDIEGIDYKADGQFLWTKDKKA